MGVDSLWIRVPTCGVLCELCAMEHGKANDRVPTPHPRHLFIKSGPWIRSYSDHDLRMMSDDDSVI